MISMDEELGEDRFSRTPAHDGSPDKAFEQTWAITLLEAVLEQLRREHSGDGKLAWFEALQIYLSGDRGTTPYVEMAARLKTSEAAIKMAVLRMRRRFGELLREEIANTVSSPQEIDGEIRALFAAVRRG